MRPSAAPVAALLVALLVAGEVAAAERLAVIAHPRCEESLSVDDLARIFLRKQRFWRTGGAIVPVNRDAASPSRGAFTHIVFGDAARRLPGYWNRLYFQGVLPPATFASDEAVKRFVAREPGAIGYVDAATVDSTVRVLLYLE